MSNEPEICTHPKWNIDSKNIGTCTNPDCEEMRQFPLSSRDQVIVLRASKCNSQIEKGEKVKEKPRKEGKKGKSKRKDRRGHNYEQLPPFRKHQYFEKNKDNIVADLLTLGRNAVISKWGIGRSALRTFEIKYLTAEQRDKITSLGVKLRTIEVKTHNGQLPAFPEFSPDWDPTVQVKWLEIYEKLIAGVKNVKESTDPTRADH